MKKPNIVFGVVEHEPKSVEPDGKAAWRYYRARHMGGGNLMLFEYHLSEEECVRFCAARKEELQTPVEFFCVAIREGEVKKEAEKGIGG